MCGKDAGVHVASLNAAFQTCELLEVIAICRHAVVMRRDAGDGACDWYETVGCLRHKTGAVNTRATGWGDAETHRLRSRRMKLERTAWHSKLTRGANIQAWFVDSDDTPESESTT